MLKTVTGWVLLASVATVVGGCVASTDPSPEPTDEKQGTAQQDLLPVNGGGGGGSGGTTGGTKLTCSDPNNPATWHCPSSCYGGCTMPNGGKGTWQCSNVTDYCCVCSNQGGGGCTHGCAPVSGNNY